MIATLLLLYMWYKDEPIRRKYQHMLPHIGTVQDYRRMVEVMFEDGFFHEHRLLVLDWFTEDLCRYHKTQSFREEYDKWTRLRGI